MDARIEGNPFTDGRIHVFTDGVHDEAFERVFKPGMVFMAERNLIASSARARTSAVSNLTA